MFMEGCSSTLEPLAQDTLDMEAERRIRQSGKIKNQGQVSKRRIDFSLCRAFAVAWLKRGPGGLVGCLSMALTPAKHS
jgi:hypothetical protein